MHETSDGSQARKASFSSVKHVEALDRRRWLVARDATHIEHIVNEPRPQQPLQLTATATAENVGVWQKALPLTWHQ